MTGCKSDVSSHKDDGTLQVYLSADPEKLNPIFNPKSIAREVFQNIFVPLADYNPETLILEPILITKIPSAERINDDIVRYAFTFKEDAVWTDGKPVVAEDYLFTLKAVLHPSVNAATWRSLLKNVKAINFEDPKSKSFTVDVSDDSMLSLEIASTLCLLPKHIYDPKGQLDAYDFSFFHDKDLLQKVEKDTNLITFAKTLNAPINYRENLINAGPYRLLKWESGQYISIVKKENYWGKKYDKNPFLEAKSDTILFKIFADELTAFVNLKDGGLDVMKFKSSELFAQLNENESYAPDFNFYTPQLMRYLYLSLNNRKPGLNDLAVRKALNSVLDIPTFIKNIEKDFGVQLNGPIHPSKPYYNKNLTLPEKDFSEAKDILTKNGWVDTNANNILDKNGVELEFDLLISSSELAKQIGLLFKNGCQELGIEIQLIEKSPRLYVKEDVNTHTYDIAALSQTMDAAPYDPYYRWHSDNIESSNISGYSNKKADTLILDIQSELDPKKRANYYLELQEILSEDLPVVFLYAPTEKIVIRKNFSGKATPKRPGYLANTIGVIK